MGEFSPNGREETRDDIQPTALCLGRTRGNSYLIHGEPDLIGVYSPRGHGSLLHRRNAADKKSNSFAL